MEEIFRTTVIVEESFCQAPVQVHIFILILFKFSYSGSWAVAITAMMIKFRMTGLKKYKAHLFYFIHKLDINGNSNLLFPFCFVSFKWNFKMKRHEKFQGRYMNTFIRILKFLLKKFSGLLKCILFIHNMFYSNSQLIFPIGKNKLSSEFLSFNKQSNNKYQK